MNLRRSLFIVPIRKESYFQTSITSVVIEQLLSKWNKHEVKAMDVRCISTKEEKKKTVLSKCIFVSDIFDVLQKVMSPSLVCLKLI